MKRREFLPACLSIPILGMVSGCGSAGQANKQTEPNKMVFSHIGIVTTEKKPNERFVEATRVWVTDFQNHPYHVEWLRFEPDTTLTGPVREMPHVAYEVDSIAEAGKGLKELLAPFDPGVFGFVLVGFYQTEDGAVVEFMERKKEDK